jgi:hypothetical protein
LRQSPKRHLRVAKHDAHAQPVGKLEPLASYINEVMTFAGYIAADVSRMSGLDSRHLSQILNRTERYTRPPKTETLEALARVPELDLADLTMAVVESLGLPVPKDQPLSVPRKAAIAMLMTIPEDRLGETLKHLGAIAARKG